MSADIEGATENKPALATTSEDEDIFAQIRKVDREAAERARAQEEEEAKEPLTPILEEQKSLDRD